MAFSRLFAFQLDCSRPVVIFYLLAIIVREASKSERENFWIYVSEIARERAAERGGENESASATSGPVEAPLGACLQNYRQTDGCSRHGRTRVRDWRD